MATLDLILKSLTAVATLGIGKAASILAYQQFKISKAKLKFDLYEKRLALLKTASNFAATVARELFEANSIRLSNSPKIQLRRRFCLIVTLTVTLETYLANFLTRHGSLLTLKPQRRPQKNLILRGSGKKLNCGLGLVINRRHG